MIYQYTIGIIESFLETIFTILIGISDSYFLSLILLAIIVRLATKPLEKYANFAVKAQAEIDSVLVPQIYEIKQNHKGAKQHNIIKRLYSRYSYHPVFSIRSLAGIGVQLPFFIAAYFMLSAFTDLKGVVVPFLGDLGKPDSIIFGQINLMPFVMTLINVLALITVPNFNRKSLIQGLFISLMFLVLLYNSPLGLLIYWTTSNLVSLISNFIPQLTEKLTFKKTKTNFNNTFIGRVFEDYAFLFFITNLAILIPLLGVLGDQFNFFTAHSLSSEYIIKLLLVISLVPALILTALRWLCKRFGIANGFDKIALFIFLGLFLFYTFNKVGYGLFPSKYEPYILIVFTIVLTFLAVMYFIKKQTLRYFSYFSLIIPLALLNFIYVSPASSLFQNSGKVKFPETEMMSDTPVFLLIFDELSGLTLQNAKGELDKLRYPGFAELAKKADYFPNALTADFRTDISVPSIVSGNLRLDKDQRGLAKGENLIDLFHSKGPIEAHSVILPADLMSKQDRNQNLFLSDLMTLYLHIISHQDWIENKIGVIPQTWKDFGIFYTPEQHPKDQGPNNRHAKIFLDWIRKLNENGAKSQFNLLHFQLPHAHYNITSLGRSVMNSKKILVTSKNKETFFADQNILNVLSHNYRQQLEYTDHLLLKFIKALKNQKLFDKSLIILTTDHGVNYNRKGVSRRIPVNEESWKNIISVPLLVKYPFQEKPSVNSSFVTTLDISSTILKVIGINSPWKTVGQNIKEIENNTQSQSVELIPHHKEYFKNIKSLFQNARERNIRLFGEATPIHTIAINYTENPIYDSLLMSDLDDFNIDSTSDLSTIFHSTFKSPEITHYGHIYDKTNLANNRVIAAVVDGQIQAIFKSVKTGNQNGTFAFSLPESDMVPLELKIALYEIASVSPFVLKKINTKNHQKFLEEEFKNKTSLPYDWVSSVATSNGLDTLEIEKDLIRTSSSKSTDPFIVFKKFSNKAISEPIFHIKIESNREISLQLFYQTEKKPKFNKNKPLVYKINKGDNDIYIKIPAKDVLGNFRLDLGNQNISTNTSIYDIEIKY